MAKATVTTVADYVAALPEERGAAIEQLRKTIKKALPKGFEETMSYGMIGYVVPHSKYPAGYHCDPKLPLPFLNLASQKNFIALYHMGLYADEKMLNWFSEAFVKATGKKPDMGKSCIRFKKEADIPYALIGELCSKMSPADWIAQYEKMLKKK
ncbi:MAG: DUF1801 domain-containing protein [Chitinophagales bacterium]